MRSAQKFGQSYSIKSKWKNKTFIICVFYEFYVPLHAEKGL